MNLQNIELLFGKLKKATTNPEEVAKLCKKYLSKDTPTYELNIMGATIDPYNLIKFLKDKESGMPIIEQTAECLTTFLQEKGYRNNIRTYQEHQLVGSSGSGLNTNGNEFPYTVGAVLNGDISVEEARQARKLEYISGGALGAYWGLDGMHWFLFPEIDEKGVTVRDPLLMDSKGKVLAERLANDFLYKR